MSRSQHPIALRHERQVGGSTRLLATVMGLPLVDGIFAALVLAGALQTVGGILQVGLLIFGGSATVAVVLCEMDGPPRRQLRRIGLVGAGVIGVAAAVAALAPTIASVINLTVFERFAALVMLAVAAKTASARVGDLLPRPAVIVGLGLLASVDPASASLATRFDPDLILRAVAAAGVGVGFAGMIAAFGPTLRGIVHLDRFRFGSAVALGTLPLGLLGLVPGNAPLAVLVVSGLLAFDPGGTTDSRVSPGQADTPGGPDSVDTATESEPERAPWL